ncbi:aminofutalosine deaminase family hydrolase [Helicobacter sp. 11S02629-2]|uniref:aminofutalosine deaminase family hydrolase n=1 Tax=Helicobacter sp. 11S02629-2 TaxID=1476195 RepID=UPI000BA69F88|nr:aminofutalosine deaminase family hydrolase [Helicobacter sp. 11S02629-2]PAF45934.1 hypothetical protein BKH40_00540 [Helicobacter sp. 11S02629-2]
MKLLGARYVLTADESFSILENGAVLYEGDKIVEVGSYEALSLKTEDKSFYKDSILTPAFINAHVHFEFSKNSGEFRYGSFGAWLESVIGNRGEVLKDASKAIKEAISESKKSGVGTIGAISSYDMDLNTLLESGLRTVYFSEVLGANITELQSQIDALAKRLETSLSHKSAMFIPSLAVHSPYSISKELLEYTLNLARNLNLLVSTHFLESKEELEWLESSSGFFKHFYEDILHISNPKPNFSVEGFLESFYDLDCLFVHCLQADESVLQKILSKGKIVSCPRSNLLLNQKMGLNEIVATDGKSSNINLNMLDELRAAFFTSIALNPTNLESLAIKLLQSVTCKAALALRLENGSLQSGKLADMALFSFPKLEDIKDISLHLLLYAKEAQSLIVGGVERF